MIILNCHVRSISLQSITRIKEHLVLSSKKLLLGFIYLTNRHLSRSQYFCAAFISFDYFQFNEVNIPQYFLICSNNGLTNRVPTNVVK